MRGHILTLQPGGSVCGHEFIYRLRSRLGLNTTKTLLATRLFSPRDLICGWIATRLRDMDIVGYMIYLPHKMLISKNFNRTD